MRIAFTINGQQRIEEAPADMSLVAFLRDVLDLTGTKHACDGGECGACTVLVDDVPMNACLMLAPQIRDSEVITIEGLARDGVLHPVQASFAERSALQCGYCGSGMLLTAKAFLEKTPNPTREEARQAIAGNLCRCTGYTGFIDAILAAADVMQGDVR
jgi:carbon-monoxide dehydrogenase small subunit